MAADTDTRYSLLKIVITPGFNGLRFGAMDKMEKALADIMADEGYKSLSVGKSNTQLEFTYYREK